eukprot:sb/3474531/
MYKHQIPSTDAEDQPDQDMFERREIQLSPCFFLVTTIFIVGTAVFVPLSIKGYVSMDTHCSEFRIDDPYISWPYAKQQVKHTKELMVFGFLTLVCLVTFAMLRPTPVNQSYPSLGDIDTWCGDRTRCLSRQTPALT